ncbi:hypothetical protein TWF696_005593 [Orbilia brochopaga]|uniref:BTB domain-containing protein n=1 Tax=Orbilia brochopaga TaxID=3140254 RepID=A0AAV9V4A2_9PEZI
MTAHTDGARILSPTSVFDYVAYPDILGQNDEAEALYEMWDMFEKQEFTDCKIAIFAPNTTQPVFIKCHKFILCSRIPHFRHQLQDSAALAAGTDEDGDIIFTIKDVDVKLVLHILAFAYTARIEALEPDFVDLSDSGDPEEPVIRYGRPHGIVSIHRAVRKDEILLPAKLAALAMYLGMVSLAHRARDVYNCASHGCMKSPSVHRMGNASDEAVELANPPRCPLDVTKFDADLLCEYVELMYNHTSIHQDKKQPLRLIRDAERGNMMYGASAYFRTSGDIPGKYQQAFDRVPVFYEDLVDWYIDGVKGYDVEFDLISR